MVTRCSIPRGGLYSQQRLVTPNTLESAIGESRPYENRSTSLSLPYTFPAPLTKLPNISRSPNSLVEADHQSPNVEVLLFSAEWVINEFFCFWFCLLPRIIQKLNIYLVILSLYQFLMYCHANCYEHYGKPELLAMVCCTVFLIKWC